MMTTITQNIQCTVQDASKKNRRRFEPKPYPKDVLIQSDPKTNIKSSKDVLIIDHPLLVKER